MLSDMPTVVSMTILMAVVCFFAIKSDQRATEIQTAYGPVYSEKLFVFFIIISLSLYGAMRTHGNDTSAYISGFINLPSGLTIRSFFSSGRWSVEKGPIFALLEIICKNNIVNNYHVFFLIVGLITNGLIVWFLRKYTSNLVFPIFLYICMGGFGTSLTGMRQAMATAIVIWTIPLAMERKWLKALVVLWVAFRIHFITILYIVSPFLLNRVWNSVTIVAILAALLAGTYFTQFGQLLLDIGDSLGFENYDDSILFGNRINILRVLVCCVSPVLSFIKRNYLSEKSPVIRCMANLSVVAAGFVFLGLFGKANTFGRFGLLFEPAIYVTLPTIIGSIEDEKKKRIIFAIAIICFLIYYVFGHAKNGIREDFYRLESIFNW